MGAPAVPASIKQQLRGAFKQTLIAAGGFDAASAEAALQAGDADLIAFGRPFIANPDLVERMQKGAANTEAEMSTFYTADALGYTDYAALA
jgi:N-ethylmaleimide reductase